MNSAKPVVLLSGGTHTIGTADTSANNTSNYMFRLRGRGSKTDGTTGLGTDQPIKGNGADPALPGAENPIGTLLKATGGATIEVKIGASDTSGGRAISLDKALYEATLPIIDLFSSGATQTTLTTAREAIRMDDSKAVSLGPVIALDNGLITVKSGALIRLRRGSNWDITGDLLKLTNGSQITVVNGPLIRVGELASSGDAKAKATLNVSGALVNFGGTGTNKIIVRNSLCAAACAVKSGIQVLESGPTATKGTITIGPNPIKGAGAIEPRVVLGPGVVDVISNKAAIIQATSNGVVDIKAP